MEKFLPPSEKQSSHPSQEEAQIPDNELFKGCLYSLFKFAGLLVGFLLLLFLLVDNYKVGSSAFKKGLWESAIFFLENVKTKDEHYKDAQEKLRLAREKLEQEEEEH